MVNVIREGKWNIIQPGVTMRQIRRKHLFVKPFISYSYLNSYPFSPFVKNYIVTSYSIGRTLTSGYSNITTV